MKNACVGVIGAGRVGATLAARLRAAGHEVAAVSGRSEAKTLRVSTMLPGVTIRPAHEVALLCEILILAVPDDVLVDVVGDTAPWVHQGQIVLHTSGRHGRSVLEPLAKRGARTLAMHPAMTFTGTTADVERRCVFGVTAEESDQEIAAVLAEQMGGTTVPIAEADRAMYHAAMAHGANHLSTLVVQAADLLTSIGASDPAALLGPLLNASLENTLTYKDAALTGPVARGDAETVRRHVEAIADPDIRDSYVAMARATARRVGDRAEILRVLEVETAR